MKKNSHINSRMIYIAFIVIALSALGFLTSFAFFNFTRTGPVNRLGTSYIDFSFIDISDINIGNAYPISESNIDNSFESNFNIQAHNTLSEGVRYKVYAVLGDNETGKTRLRDDVMSLKFDVPADGNGFTTMINNYETAKSPVFIDGKALISTGIVKNTENLTTKSYTISLWIDSNKINISSTTKRANNYEGNPSLADETSGNVTADRYIENDSNLVSTVLYPARVNQQGKIIYTTKEFASSYYSIKIVVEAEEVVEDEELVYFDAKGGTIDTETKMVTVGETYGTLPTPTKDGYTFLGWNGKNLFNIDDFTETYAPYQLIQWEKVIFDGEYVWKIYGGMNTGGMNINYMINQFKSNTRYTISLDTYHVTNDSLLGPFPIVMYDSGYNYIITNSNITNQWGKSIFTTPSGKNISCIIWAYGSGQGYSYIKNWQIEEGTEATAFEPYYVTNSVEVSQEKDHVLRAIWQANTYNIVFNANGGTGTMANQQMTYDMDANLTENAFTRDGYTFLGWSTIVNGSVEYSNSDTVKNLATTGNFNLYAVWQQNS